MTRFLFDNVKWTCYMHPQPMTHDIGNYIFRLVQLLHASWNDSINWLCSFPLFCRHGSAPLLVHLTTHRYLNHLHHVYFERKNRRMVWIWFVHGVWVVFIKCCAHAHVITLPVYKNFSHVDSFAHFLFRFRAGACWFYGKKQNSNIAISCLLASV